MKLATTTLTLAALLLTAAPAVAESRLPPCPDDQLTVTNCAYDGPKDHSYISIDWELTYTKCMPGYVMDEARICQSTDGWDEVTLTDTDPIDTDPIEPVTPAVTPAVTAPVTAPITPASVTAPVVTAPVIAPAAPAAAWALFDAYGAALLPDHPTRVEYVRTSSTPITPGAGTIVVWDHTGTHHLFSVTAN